jgi:hypothetical protein
MNSKAEFFRLAGSIVVIEYKDRSIITSIKIIEFGEKTTKQVVYGMSVSQEVNYSAFICTLKIKD